MRTRSVRWRALDSVGLEHLTIGVEGGAIVARSVVIGQRGGMPYGVSYTVRCRPDWTTAALDLETTAGQNLRMATEATGR